MIQTEYKLYNNVTELSLEKMGFYFNGSDWTKSIPIYYYKPPILNNLPISPHKEKIKKIKNKVDVITHPNKRVERIPLYFMSMIINIEEKIFAFSVVNGSGSIYPGYYNRDFGKDLSVEEMDKRVLSEIKKLQSKKIIKG